MRSFQIFILIFFGSSLLVPLSTNAEDRRVNDDTLRGGVSQPMESMSALRKRFLGDGQKLPDHEYRAYYFSSTDPSRQLVKAETVARIAMSYAWEKGPSFSLPSEEFSGYWIGNFEVKTAGKFRVHVAQSWSATTVVVDGNIIFQKESHSGSVPLSLEAGKHTIEVSHANSWHTVGFSVDVLPDEQVYALDTLRDPVRRVIRKHPGVEVWYAGVYEGSAADQTIYLTLKRSISPILLILNSYESVRWNIVNPADSPLAGIVLTSLQPGSSIQGVASNIPVWNLGYVPGKSFDIVFDNGPGNLREYKTLVRKVKYLTRKSIFRFIGSYEAASLSFEG